MRIPCPKCTKPATINRGRPSKMNHTFRAKHQSEQLFRVYISCTYCGAGGRTDVHSVVDHPNDADDKPSQFELTLS